MRHFLSVLFSVFFLSCFFTMAQDVTLLERLRSDIADSRVRLDYSFSSVSGSARYIGDGEINVQGECYLLSGNGLDIYCDGSTVWTLDSSAKEVIIDSAEQGLDVLSNPAMFLLRFHDYFEVSTLDVKDSGDIIYELAAGENVRGVSSCTLEVVLSEGKAYIRSGQVRLDDGMAVDFKIVSMEYLEKVSPDEFRPSSVFDTWEVTDLR